MAFDDGEFVGRVNEALRNAELDRGRLRNDMNSALEGIRQELQRIREQLEKQDTDTRTHIDKKTGAIWKHINENIATEFTNLRNTIPANGWRGAVKPAAVGGGTIGVGYAIVRALEWMSQMGFFG